MSKPTPQLRPLLDHVLGAATIVAASIFALALLSACTGKDPAPKTPMDGEPAAGPTNRIDIPLAVRQNLGITFSKVERRPVASTLRIPGRFELDPAARRDYSARVPGTVTVMVSEGQGVRKGDPIATISSPLLAELAELRAMSDADVAEADADNALAHAQSNAATDHVEQATARAKAALPRRDAALKHAAALAAVTGHWRTRAADLKAQLSRGLAVADALADAEAQLLFAQAGETEATSELATIDSELRSLELDVAEARTAMGEALAVAAAADAKAAAARKRRDAAGIRIQTILGTSDPSSPSATTIHAEFDGTVTHALATGSYAEPGAVIATIVNPRALRLRASLPVSDAARLPRTGTAAISQLSAGGLSGDSSPAIYALLDGIPGEPGMVDALLTPASPPDWALAGLLARAEFMLDGGTPALSIPVRATIRDGLDLLAFVRDPDNPDKVIRQPVTIGPSDGAWVAVTSGVGPDDEVVLDGIYELKLTGAGKAEAGGHFHADGTFHAGPDH